MLHLSTHRLRQAFLDFFAIQHGHTIIQGAPLIPENDPTVLFTTAGMHPLVPYLLGETHPAGKRLVDVQRCIRTHDIDEVGDASHLTMFEMLGNWSLGDYFKKESIEMSWEFLTEILAMDPAKLAVTCFIGDDDAPCDHDAQAAWLAVGMTQDRIGFLPKTKNWWGPAGQTGPCGPDTEIFYWIGKESVPPRGSNPANDEHNWLEIWNNVFMQYRKEADGSFLPLIQHNVDTGMGLERVAQILQGVTSVFAIDTMQPIMSALMTDTPEAVSDAMKHRRIIADHLRAAVFLIADGVLPSNTDQGYVLRKLIRRALRSSRHLKHSNDIVVRIGSVIIDIQSEACPMLTEKRASILAVLSAEADQFLRSLDAGLKQLEKIIAALTSSTVEGATAFHVYDTYGFPLELTREILKERGIGVDETGFQEAFLTHQSLSRSGAEKKFAGGLADHSDETTKLHTATHLLNAALRHILGPHVIQKGSNITAERLRFDFCHDAKMTDDQKKMVEDLVNHTIAADLPIFYTIMSTEEAKNSGAIGAFTNRYGENVKVYTIGDGSFSKEICGGPHAARTGMLGHFTLEKEESASAGIRRIKGTLQGGPTTITLATEDI